MKKSQNLKFQLTNHSMAEKEYKIGLLIRLILPRKHWKSVYLMMNAVMGNQVDLQRNTRLTVIYPLVRD